MKLRTRLFEHVLRQQHPCHPAIPYVIEAGYIQLNQLNHLFMLRHPRRFWFASLAVALVSAVVLGPWLETASWLVTIPVVAGGLLVAPGELLDELCGKVALRAADKSSVPGRKL